MDAISITNLKKGYKNFNLDIKDLTIKSGYKSSYIATFDS